MKQIISYLNRILLKFLDGFAIDLKNRTGYFGFVVMFYCLIALLYALFVIGVYCHLIPGIGGR